MRWRPFFNISIRLNTVADTKHFQHSPALLLSLCLQYPLPSLDLTLFLAGDNFNFFGIFYTWGRQKEIDDVLSVRGNSNSNIISAIIAVITTMDKTYWELLTTLEPRSIELHQHSFRLQNFLSPLQSSSSGYHLRYSFMSLGSSFQAGINLGNLISE